MDAFIEMFWYKRRLCYQVPIKKLQWTISIVATEEKHWGYFVSSCEYKRTFDLKLYSMGGLLAAHGFSSITFSCNKFPSK